MLIPRPGCHCNYHKPKLTHTYHIFFALWRLCGCAYMWSVYMSLKLCGCSLFLWKVKTENRNLAGRCGWLRSWSCTMSCLPIWVRLASHVPPTTTPISISAFLKYRELKLGRGADSLDQWLSARGTWDNLEYATRSLHMLIMAGIISQYKQGKTLVAEHPPLDWRDSQRAPPNTHKWHHLMPKIDLTFVSPRPIYTSNFNAIR